MNYVDAGSAIGQKSFTRKTSKKTSIFYQQAQKEKEEERYVKEVEELQIFKDHPELLQHQNHFKHRNEKFFEMIEQLIKVETSLVAFGNSFNRYGLQISDTGITFGEFDPTAKSVALFGEFNQGNKEQYQCVKDHHDRWEVFLNRDDTTLQYPIAEGQAIKVHVEGETVFERNPVWANSAKIDEKGQEVANLYFPDYAWKNQQPSRPLQYSIVHVILEMYTEQLTTDYVTAITQVGNWHQQGINTLLLKDYQRQFFFAQNAQLGTPGQLKELIDTCHGQGIQVLLEVNHTEYGFTDPTNIYGHGGRFDFSKWETLRLLLSSFKFWVQEYQIDGFVVKAVSKIIYGDGVEKFNEQVNIDGLVFLMLATDLVRQNSEHTLLIADDRSAYPALTRSIRDGGLGFDLTVEELLRKKTSMEQIPEEESKQ